jgi:AcrR family transcriptional regulator
MASTKREQLVDTALEMFYRRGFSATGIDKVLAEAGVAKMTLYNHFKSKDELILAALRRRDERFRHWLMRSVEERADAPRERLLAVFTALDGWFRQEDFRGCMFINAAAEFSGIADPIQGAAAEHKRLVAGYLGDLAEKAGAKDPQRLALELAMLIDGAIVCAHVCGVSDAADRARTAAEVLIDAALAD